MSLTRVGMFPNPWPDDRWSREGNPHLRFLAQSIADSGSFGRGWRASLNRLGSDRAPGALR